ncbi:iron donor protein CyaY [beta proteobacterium MWH-UniP1]
MTETEFLDQVATVWRGVESKVDLWADEQDLDVEACRVGPVLEIEFDSGRKIVINPQTPMQQIWLASPHGAFHFQCQGGQWVDTRTGTDFWAVLAEQAKLILGRAID